MRREDMFDIIAGFLHGPSQNPYHLAEAEALLMLIERNMIPPARQGALVGMDGFPVHCWDEATEMLPDLPKGNSPVGRVKRKGFFDNMHIYRGPDWEETAKRVMETHKDVFKKLAENGD